MSNQRFGNTNTGNTAKRAFGNAGTFADNNKSTTDLLITKHTESFVQ